MNLTAMVSIVTYDGIMVYLLVVNKLIVDKSRFAIDTVESESIVMDLVGGRLYLFEGCASTFLECLATGATVATIEQTVNDKYGEQQRVVFMSFVQSLQEKGILLEVSDDSSVNSLPIPFVWPEELGEIVVTEYDDMSSIITMDPIHDVDLNKGWPFKGNL